MDENTKINFRIESHTDDLIACEFGAGWFFSFVGGEVKTGPFLTKEAAHDAAVALIERSVADTLSAALFGEAP